MKTGELIAVAFILISAVVLLCSLLGWFTKEAGIFGAGGTIAVPALLGYLQMQARAKANERPEQPPV